MKLITILSGIIALISGAMLAGSERLFPPMITLVFAISACVLICGLAGGRRARR